jgi:hypothetical protein
MIERDRRLAQLGQPLGSITAASGALDGTTVCSDEAIVAHKGSSPATRVHHTHEGQTYKFTHLEPHTETFVRPAAKDQPSESFTVDIRYSDHCFTRSPRPGENYPAELVYRNGDKKIRLFCPKRNEMSKLLPNLIRSLPDRKPQHNGNNGNFFTIDAMDLNGDPVKYIIIFNVRKSGKGRMELLVETAYTEDPDYGSAPLTGRRVRFWIILNNTHKGLKIHR